MPPLDRNRSGTIFAEGAAALVIEAMSERPNAGQIRGDLGGADTNNAYHTAPDKEGGDRALKCRALEGRVASRNRLRERPRHGDAHDVTGAGVESGSGLARL